MKTGVVKSFNEQNKYGFIIVDGTFEEIFVHSSELRDQIRKGDKVTFEVVEGKKGMAGLNAINVKVI